MSFIDDLKARASTLKREVRTLYLAWRHPGTPLYAKALLVVVPAYALSPIDLIPDFIPVIGLLDDLVLIPLGILLVRRMIPPDVMDECRTETETSGSDATPLGRFGAVGVVVVWLVALSLVSLLVYRTFISRGCRRYARLPQDTDKKGLRRGES